MLPGRTSHHLVLYGAHCVGMGAGRSPLKLRTRSFRRPIPKSHPEPFQITTIHAPYDVFITDSMGYHVGFILPPDQGTIMIDSVVGVVVTRRSHSANSGP